MLNISIKRMNYSCSDANPSLGPTKNWSDICCFACSFRKSFHLAAILTKQMQQIFLTPQTRTCALTLPSEFYSSAKHSYKELLEAILHSQRQQLHTAFINFILCYNI